MPYDPFQGLTRACKEDRLEEEDLPHLPRKMIVWIGCKVEFNMSQHDMSTLKIIMWTSTDFFGHVVGETEGKHANHCSLIVCEHCKLFFA